MKKIIMLLAVLITAIHVAAQEPKYQAGVHYQEVARPVKVDLKDGHSGEVLVFFKYTCPACYQLHPYLQAWESTLGDDIVVEKVPVFQPDVYSKAYYAADLLNLDDGFHQEIYKKMHIERKPLRRLEEFAALAANYGADAEHFSSAANSFSINIKINQGIRTAGQAQVSGTPFLLVNGKYLLSGPMAGSYDAMLDIAEYLLGKDKPTAEN